MNELGMLNEYQLTDYPNINRSSNLKMKNRYLKFFDVTRTSPAYAVYVLYLLCLRSDTLSTEMILNSWTLRNSFQKIQKKF